MKLQEKFNFKYLDQGSGEVLMLLHGLFGELSNWNTVTAFFSKKYRIVIPILPIFTLPLSKVNLEGLLEYIIDFTTKMNLKTINIMGNSLGGHLGLLFALQCKKQLKKLILTGSSGLYENTMGGSYPKRGDYNYISKKVGTIFYNPRTASQALIQQVFKITTNRDMVRRVIMCARSAQKNNLLQKLAHVIHPTLLVWGLNDIVTPPFVAHQFYNRIPNATLKFLDHCGHVPMMEHPKRFNQIVTKFLEKKTKPISNLNA